jgi:putative protease
MLTVLCRSMEQLEAALACGVEEIYCDFEDPRRYKEAAALCPKVLAATPRIIKPGEEGYLKLIERSGVAGVLVRNLAALDYYQRSSLRQVGDFSLNIANPLSAQLLSEHSSLERMTISYDLNISQVLELLASTPPSWLELTLHQHMPMFHMEHCVFCTFMSPGTDYRNCGRPCEKHVVHLRDRVGQLHRLSADVGCRNTLFNGRAQTGARYLPALLAQGLRHFRVELLAESRSEAEHSLRLYQELLRGQCSSAALQEELEVVEKLGVTEGTLRV